MEIFEYEVEPGAVMDYLDHRFVLVVKDDDWNDEQLNLLKSQGMDLSFGKLDDVFFFVAENGALDSADFYFLPSQSDQLQQLEQDLTDLPNAVLDFYLIDKDNAIKARRSKTLDLEDTRKLYSLVREAIQTSFLPDEYEQRVERIQQRYEPFELRDFALGSVRM